MKILTVISIVSLTFTGMMAQAAKQLPKTTPNSSATHGYALCGLSPTTTKSLLQWNRGPVNGGYDEDGSGIIETEEAFTRWDFNQVHDTLQYGVEFQQYGWTNIDTCFKFVLTPLTFVEDPANALLWRTCRHFVFYVLDDKGNRLTSGTNKGYACRNFATSIWKIIGS